MNVLTFTLFQRPFYTRQVLEAWKQVRGIKDWEVHFHIEPSGQFMAQWDIVENFAEWHGNTIECAHDEIMGVLVNPHHAIDTAFHTAFHETAADYVVLAEEDVLPATDVLEYFDFAETQTDYLAACAWSDANGPADEASGRFWFNPWLWGCSRTMWEEVISPTWDLDYSTGDDKGPGGWDCNLGLRVVHDYSMEVLFPKASRSQHIGQWLGTHQDPNQFGEAEKPTSFVQDRTPVDWKLT